MRSLRLLAIGCLYLLAGSPTLAMAEHDPLLLRAQAAIYPKIIMLDKDVESKTVADRIFVEILYQPGDEDDAARMKRLMEHEYRKNLGRRRLQIRLTRFDQFVESAPAATAYILMNGTPDAHHRVASFAADHGRVSFSYDYRDIEHNVLVSMFVKEKTYIYLNKAALSGYDIRFLPSFYKIVRVLE